MVIPKVSHYGSKIRLQVGKRLPQNSQKVLECEGNSGEFVELVPEQLNYLGPKDLTQYFIRSRHFSVSECNKYILFFCRSRKSLLRFDDTPE